MTDDKKKIEPAQEDDINHLTSLHQLNEQLLSISRQKQLIYQWGIKFLASFLGYSTRD